MKKTITRVAAFVLTIVMVVGILPLSALATIPNWAENNVVFDGTSFGTNGYYNVISKKDYVLVPGAAVESEIVLNNATGTRRQVLHIIEVDPSNPDVSIVPGYHQIDKLAEDPNNEANWSHKELTDMAKYYEENLGYNIVGGMNTDLYYDTYAPRILVYNGKSIGVKGEYAPSSSILYVFKDAEGNISCDVKAFNRTDFNKYLEEGILLHAVSVSFGMTVKDGELVSKTEERTSSAAARSMVGVKEDGTLVICMNDGRGANNSVGFCNYELGESMLALGCKWAANCDGGGSSTFISKRVGEEDFTMRSVPCDGAQRPTAHGIFVVSNVAPTGVLDNVNINAAYDIFAPKTEYTFGAEAIDTHGYAMDMPADAVWALSDDSFGTIENGKFVSNGTKGSVDIQVLSGGQVVGSKTITVADPEVFTLSATSTVVPYSTAEKVRTITLPIVAMTGEANVYVDTNAVSVALSNEAAGTLDGFNFTATSDTSIAGVDVTVTYGDTVLTYAIEFGKGSEIIFDFENGDRGGFMGFEEAKKWSQDNGVNNTLVGSDPLAGQFNEYLSSETFMSTAAKPGADGTCIQTRNGTDRDFTAAFNLSQGRGDAHAFNGAQKTGNAFQIFFGNIIFHSFRNAADSSVTTTEELCVFHDPVLQLQLRNGSSIKELLGDGIQVCAGFGTGSSHTISMGGGVGIAEAAGVRRDSDVEPPGNLLGHFCTHVHEKLVDDLTAGGGGSIYIFSRSKGSGGSMMVNPQRNAAEVLLMSCGEQMGRSHVHADERIRVCRCIYSQSQQAAAQERRCLHVVQNMGGLSKQAQANTQGGGRADGIAVGAGMGQNAVIVMLKQPCCTLIPRHRVHRKADC